MIMCSWDRAPNSFLCGIITLDCMVWHFWINRLLLKAVLLFDTLSAIFRYLLFSSHLFSTFCFVVYFHLFYYSYLHHISIQKLLLSSPIEAQ